MEKRREKSNGIVIRMPQGREANSFLQHGKLIASSLRVNY